MQIKKKKLLGSDMQTEFRVKKCPEQVLPVIEGGGRRERGLQG
jgi:hypothetical protein